MNTNTKVKLSRAEQFKIRDAKEAAYRNSPAGKAMIAKFIAQCKLRDDTAAHQEYLADAADARLGRRSGRPSLLHPSR